MEPSNQVLLRLQDWSLHRRTPVGEVAILKEINLELHAGQWLAVLGANGSGKSSLLKFLASDDSPLSLGRAIMFQDPDEQIIGGTVERELSLGRPGLSCASVLEEFGLDGQADLDPRLLSAGQKQRLVLAVAIAGEPEVLFCDEPTALQDQQQAGWVLDRLQRWKENTGGTLVTATCDRREVLRADQLLVLKDGRVVLHGPCRDLLDHPLVEDLLGETAPDQEWFPGPGVDVPSRTTVLSMRGVGFQFGGSGLGLSEVNLELKAGQRVGIIGPNGSGKSTLLAACVGARNPDQGEVTISGRKLYKGKARDLDHGLALLAPQFPEYIFTRSTVAEEVALDPALAHLDLAVFLQEVGLPANCQRRNPHSLSSGQKRRLALGLVIFSGRPLLLLDEPTAALDRHGRQLVAELLERIPADTGLVVASHDRAFLRLIGCQCLELGENEGLAAGGE